MSLRPEGEIVDRICSKEMKVGTLDVHYFQGGEGDPLVVIHGGGDSARAWLENLTELADHYTVYAPDLPGFGHSQPIGDNFHISEYVEFVEGFTHGLELERFHLMGHSLGGGIALNYALKFPRKVKRLVLVSSMFLGKEIALWARFLSYPASVRSLAEAGITAFKVLGWFIRLLYAPFEFIVPFSRVQMGIGRAVMTLHGQTIVLLNRLSELVMPTLLIWGARDGIVPARHAYAAAEVIPKCQLHVFEGCGHSVYKQKVHEFSDLLVRFLGKHDPL